MLTLYQSVVLHFITSPETAREDLPRFLNGQKPSRSSNDDIGSQDYDKEPEAILLGLGYYNEIVENLRQACEDTKKGLPWLHGGLSKAQFDDMLANNPPLPPAQQGPFTAGKIKKMLTKLLDEGKGGKDGSYVWYEGSHS